MSASSLFPQETRGKFVYGASMGWAPYESLDARGTLHGFNIDLVRELAQEAGQDVEVRPEPWDRVLPDLQDGRIDLASFYYSEARARQFAYLGKVWSVSHVMGFLPGRDAYPQTIEQLAGEVVTVRGGTLPEDLLRALPDSTRPEILEFSTLDQGLQLLASRRATVIVGPDLWLESKAEALDLVLVERPVQTLAYHLVGRPADVARLDWVAPALDKLRQNGTFDRLVERHLVRTTRAPGWLRTLGAVAGVLLVGFLGTLAWNRSLKAQVAARARELAQAADARSRAEQALRESERLLHLIGENTADPIMIRDMERRLLYVNPALEGLTGYSRDDLESGFVPWFHPDDAKRMAALYEGLFRGERVSGEVFRLVTRGGDTKWVSAVWGPLHDDSGRQVGVYGVDRDVTAIKRAEEERQQLEAGLRDAQRLESLGILAGGIAHDFNNALGTIVGNANLTMRSLPADARARVWVGNIERAAEQAATLTQHMLAYAGRGMVTVGPVDLSALVGEMAPLLEAVVRSPALLERDLEPGLPVVRGDRAQLQQLVLNLVTNAAESLPDGNGRVTLRTAAEDGAGPQGPTGGAAAYVRLEVADTGRGMDEATRARIFDPFFTTNFLGRGLGLAAVQGIVKSHGGSIDVETAPERGTCFRVRLPVARLPLAGLASR